MDATERRIRIRVDHDRCVGSTMCIQYAPEVFALNDGRQATVANRDGGTPALIREAAEQCPVSAIILEDEDTGEQIFP